MGDLEDMDVLGTWTDGLNRALAAGEPLAGLRAMTDKDCVRILRLNG